MSFSILHDMIIYKFSWLCTLACTGPNFLHLPCFHTEMEVIMVDRWRITIPELTGSEERGVYVYLPESYQYDPGKRYPVLYMFDGHNVFFDSDATYGKCWGMKEYMDYTNTQLIIAAVECNHSPDHGRLKEYSPYNFFEANIGRIEGRGKVTMEWMTKTFKKEIDKRYRTLPDREHTFIAGSSMGGLMSLYAVLNYNTYYSRAAALSPSIWVAPEQLERLAHTSRLLKTVVYMDYGELEFHNRAAVRRQFASLSSAMIEKGVLLSSRIVPDGTHCEASWEKQIPFFMGTLFS